MRTEKKIKIDGMEHIFYKDSKTGQISVSIPNQTSDMMDTVNLTEKTGAKTIDEGINQLKKWYSNSASIKGLPSPKTVKKMFTKSAQ